MNGLIGLYNNVLKSCLIMMQKPRFRGFLVSVKSSTVEVHLQPFVHVRVPVTDSRIDLGNVQAFVMLDEGFKSLENFLGSAVRLNCENRRRKPSS